jgi:type II secretory pathway component PulF
VTVATSARWCVADTEMPLIVTPGQFSQRAELYHQLGQLTAAGLGLIPALEHLQQHPPSRAFRAPLGLIIGELSKGSTFAESLQHAGRWATAFDVALLDAGERSGRLDAGFRLLADYYADRARIVRQVIVDIAYPAFILHFAVVLFPFPEFFRTGNAILYLAKVLGVLLPIYVGTFLLIFAAQGRHGETWRALMERLLHPVPILGTARRYLALSRLSASLEALLSAGVTIIEAWELAAVASGSPALRRAVFAWKPQLLAGKTPAELATVTREFPEMFSNQYASAEISGKLDETLRRLHKYFQEEGTRKIHAVAQWTPRLIYLIIMLVIAYKIVHFWMGYFQQVRDAGAF